MRETGDDLQPGHIHKFRVACRRLRVVLTLITSPELADASRKVRSIAGKLRRAAGELRDCDVHLELLRSTELQMNGVRPAGLDDALSLLAHDRHRSAAMFAERLGRFKPGRFRRLVHELADAADRLHLESPERSLREAEARTREVETRLRTVASDSPTTPEALHELRLAVKALRYAREALAAAGAEPPPADSMLVEMQTKLGELNDVSTLTDRIGRYVGAIDAQHPTEMLASTKRLRDGLASLGLGFGQVLASRSRGFARWWDECREQGRLDSLIAADTLPFLAAPATDGVLPAGVQTRIAALIPATPVRVEATPRLSRQRPATFREDEHQGELWIAGKVIGIIDVGSNSVRLLVVEMHDHRSWRTLVEERSMTRLAHGMSGTDRLCEEAMERSTRMITQFAATARARGCTALRAFATAAVRDASNGPAFIEMVERQTGLRIELVPASEEGRLSHRSVARAIDLGEAPVAVADLGGGSLEVVLSRKGIITDNVSMPLGVVRVTEEHAAESKESGELVKAMRRDAERLLRETLPRRRTRPSLLAGCGGTFTTIATIVSAARGNPIDRSSDAIASIEPISRDEIRATLSRLAAMSDDERSRVAGLPADRADIILAGLAIVDRLTKVLKCEHLVVHAGGIREGLVLKVVRDLLDPIADPPDPSLLVGDARAVARRCETDMRHAEHVAKLSLQLHHELLEHRLFRNSSHDELDRPLLEAAALLHDSGMLVSYAGHHKHSARIVLNNDLAHVPERLRLILAMVCRHHRKRGPSTSNAAFASLSAGEQDTVLRLSGILRVADGLDRSHAQLVRSLRVVPGRHGLRIECDSEGLPIDEELKAAMKKGDVLAKLLDRDIDAVQSIAEAAASEIRTADAQTTEASASTG
jgi:exopolyphosphatase / guanosine-5'-triphosphate,3'-diphosphate pyrophosphatase